MRVKHVCLLLTCLVILAATQEPLEEITDENIHNKPEKYSMYLIFMDHPECDTCQTVKDELFKVREHFAGQTRDELTFLGIGVYDLAKAVETDEEHFSKQIPVGEVIILRAE